MSKKIMRFSSKHSEPISKSGISCLMFDSMKQCEKESIDVHLSRAIYTSGSPMSLVDNKYWKTFLNSLCPAYQLPARYKVSNTLLDKEFNRISSNVKELIAIADSVGLMCDGWSNTRNEAVINFVLILPLSLPILWKSLPSGSSSHSGEYIADEIRKVLQEINPKKVMGIVTENAASMKKAWMLLKNSYPLHNCYGCISHGLNLLFNDFIKIPTLCVLMSQATDIVKEIKLKKRGSRNERTIC
ncbi:E3 SUMO-protein ligase ZBED1 [Hydra vulgaris]|uniref:E3 SUMO-protein ligase ZBED1 n=1 Tax=Hydra vulgaris TaxID=6087 RepID=UPI001F5F60DD|nr:E3 SUMO-protein ligase ZBED1-like [Hydra vulgaris]